MVEERNIFETEFEIGVRIQIVLISNEKSVILLLVCSRSHCNGVNHPSSLSMAVL